MARNAAGASPASPSATGNRAASPISSYKLTSVHSGSATSYGATIRSANVTDLPYPSPTAGTITATDGTFASHVLLTSSGVSRGVTPIGAVQLRAVNELGDGVALGLEVTRSECAVNLRWQRATATRVGGEYRVGTFGDIAGATTSTYVDTSASAGGAPQYYRARVFLQGAERAGLTTNIDLGSRQASYPTIVLQQVSSPSRGVLTANLEVLQLGIPSIGQDYGVCATLDAQLAETAIMPGVAGVICLSAADAGRPAATAGSVYGFTMTGLTVQRTWRVVGYARNAWTVQNLTSGYLLTGLKGVYLNP